MEIEASGLSRFRLGDPIGEGADCQVFAATDLEDDAQVVIKRPHPSLIARRSARRRGPPARPLYLPPAGVGPRLFTVGRSDRLHHGRAGPRTTSATPTTGRTWSSWRNEQPAYRLWAAPRTASGGCRSGCRSSCSPCIPCAHIRLGPGSAWRWISWRLPKRFWTKGWCAAGRPASKRLFRPEERYHHVDRHGRRDGGERGDQKTPRA